MSASVASPSRACARWCASTSATPRPTAARVASSRRRRSCRLLLRHEETQRAAVADDANADETAAAAEEEEEEEDDDDDDDAREEVRSLLSNVCVVLCRPQGPQNIGGIARVLNNFGIADLRIVTPEPSALAPPYDAADATTDKATHPAETRATAPLAEEAHKFAVHADWLLRDARRCVDAAEALSDCVFVAATTARARENLPILDARSAVERVKVAASEGKVAIVFGNEATGLTNEELSLANVGVMIPTAGRAGAGAGGRRGEKRYTGGAGPTSLNLSHAVGVVAYELFRELGDGVVSGFNSRLITTEERTRLAEELVAARRSLDVLASSSSSSSSSTTSTDGEEDEEKEEEEAALLAEKERLLEEKEARAFARVLNAGPIASKDAAAFFNLARRTRGETASHTTPFAWCTPFLKDFSRRHSSPELPFQRLTGKTFD